MNNPALRNVLKRLLGIPERRGELAPERRGELELDGIAIEKWLITAEAGSKIPLNLYRPRHPAGRLPGVILTCGHGSSKSVPHMTIVSGWAFSDALCRYSKHCTRVPNHKLRAVCDWPEFLALGAEHSPLLVMNGDADVIIDQDLSGTVWRDTRAHLRALDPGGGRLRSWFCPGGGHRPYHGNRQALRFIHEQLHFPAVDEAGLAALHELNYGAWCDRHGVKLERLYGTELHYRGALLPDLGFEPIARDRLAVLTPAEAGGADVTIHGWLEACHG
jgi:hypothetical protein